MTLLGFSPLDRMPQSPLPHRSTEGGCPSRGSPVVLGSFFQRDQVCPSPPVAVSDYPKSWDGLCLSPWLRQAPSSGSYLQSSREPKDEWGKSWSTTRHFLTPPQSSTLWAGRLLRDPAGASSAILASSVSRAWMVSSSLLASTAFLIKKATFWEASLGALQILSGWHQGCWASSTVTQDLSSLNGKM